MKRVARNVGAWLAASLTLAVLGSCAPRSDPATFAPRPAGETRPDIVLVVFDRMDADLSNLGGRAQAAPMLDAFAKESVSYRSAYAAAGSKEAALASILTGVAPSALGAVQEWSGPMGWSVAPPPEIQTFPRLLRAAGYHTIRVAEAPGLFGSGEAAWNESVEGPKADWFRKTASRPFLLQIEIPVDAGPTPEKPPGIFERWFHNKPAAAESSAASKDVRTPAYLPDTPRMRAALLAERKGLSLADKRFGVIIKRLRDQGALDHAVVIVTARTGPARPRAERTLYESGVHVPLWVRWPDRRGAGETRSDLVSGADLAPSILSIAGLATPAWMQGAARFGSKASPARFAYSFQGRVDAIYERAFAVRDGRYALIVNLAQDTPQISLARAGPAAEALKLARAAGRLTPAQSRMLSAARPAHELYDVRADPDCLRDLASDPARTGDLRRLGAALNAFALSAPDYSTWAATELRDLYRPGGQVPTTTAPTGAKVGATLALDVLTPGATIVWRTESNQAWRIYSRPIPLDSEHRIEAKASRLGYMDSPVVTLPAKP